MNDLFTLFIIITAIISVISKLLKKKQETTPKKPLPPDRRKPDVWKAHWENDQNEEIETIETDYQDSIEQEEPIAITEQIKTETPESFPLPTIEESSGGNLIVDDTRSMKFNLKSSTDLKQAIILAEILGPCKARRSQHRVLKNVI